MLVDYIRFPMGAIRGVDTADKLGQGSEYHLDRIDSGVIAT